MFLWDSCTLTTLSLVRMDCHKKLMHELKAVKLEAQQYIGVFLVLESIKKQFKVVVFLNDGCMSV